MNFQKIVLSTLCLLFCAVGYFMSYVPTSLFVESGSIIAVIVLSIPACYGLWKIYGREGITASIALGVFALIIESIGIHTGFPYAPFEYTMPFGYQLFGTTPWTVFIAWSPLVIGAWLLSQNEFKKGWTQYFAFLVILLGADLILDPGAVARGLWKYANGGIWFDVPLQNFGGWIFSGTIAYAILKLVLKSVTLNDSKTDTMHLWIGSLSLLLSVFLWTGVNAGYQLWLPASIGISFGVILLRHTVYQNTSSLEPPKNSQS